MASDEYEQSRAMRGKDVANIKVENCHNGWIISSNQPGFTDSSEARVARTPHELSNIVIQWAENTGKPKDPAKK